MNNAMMTFHDFLTKDRAEGPYLVLAAGYSCWIAAYWKPRSGNWITVEAQQHMSPDYIMPMPSTNGHGRS